MDSSVKYVYRTYTSQINPTMNGGLFIRTSGLFLIPARIGDNFFLNEEGDGILSLFAHPEVINAAHTVRVIQRLWLNYDPDRVARRRLDKNPESILSIFEQLPNSIHTFELDLQTDSAGVQNHDIHRDILHMAFEQEVKRVVQIITQNRGTVVVEIQDSDKSGLHRTLFRFIAIYRKQ